MWMPGSLLSGLIAFNFSDVIQHSVRRWFVPFLLFFFFLPQNVPVGSIKESFSQISPHPAAAGQTGRQVLFLPRCECRSLTLPPLCVCGNRQLAAAAPHLRNVWSVILSFLLPQLKTHCGNSQWHVSSFHLKQSKKKKNLPPFLLIKKISLSSHLGMRLRLCSSY